MAAKKRQEILDYYPECGLTFAKGWDTAILGVAEGFGSKIKVCYDQDKIIAIEMKKGLSKRQANASIKKSDVTILHRIPEMDLNKKYPGVEFLIMPNGYSYVGLVNGFNKTLTACEDRVKVIDKFIEDGMSDEEAEEFFGYNTIDSYVGEYTPVFIKYF